MPDPYRFDHLGEHVRCIDCPIGGPIWQWPDHKRAQHSRTHGHAPRPVAAEVRRMQPLAAPPSANNHEEEDRTMATTKPTSKGDSAKQVAIEILRTAGEPLHAKEIVKRVLASGRCTSLKGKTPAATISAMLAIGSKPGGPFTRVAKARYTLAESATPTSTLHTGAAAHRKKAAPRRRAVTKRKR